MTQDEKNKNRSELFIEYVIKRISGDKKKGKKPDAGFAAAMRRADNPATEYQSWEYLAKWCDLEKKWELQPFALVAASLARIKPARDGVIGIGKAIASSYSERGSDGKEQDSAKAKLRRLLSCKTSIEVCEIMRPILRLIASRNVIVCHARLLNDLLYYGEKVRIKWATDFYGKPAENRI